MKRTSTLTLAVAAVLAVAVACGDEGPGGPGSVALLSDTLYFDYDPTDYGSEASQLEYTLVSFGISVERITTLDSAKIDSVLSRHRVLVIPEAFGGFLTDLTPGATAVIRDWVDSSGGVLIINQNSPNRSVLANMFGYALVTGSGSQSYALDAGAAGTPFAGGPSLIWENSAVTELTSASLPVGAHVIYAGPDVAVASIPQGNGVVVLMGWDWYSAAPNGPSDGGWLEVLRRALRS